MKKNIEVDKNEGTVTVTVSVNKRNYAKEPIIFFRTKDIALLLEKEGIETESCIQSDTIYNDGRTPKTQGIWVFKIKSQEKKTVEKPNLSQSNPTKENSSLTRGQETDKIKSKTKTSKKRK